MAHQSSIHDTIEAAEVIIAYLPLKEQFTIARGNVGKRGDTSPAVYLRLTSSSGAVGWGEARINPSWAYETTESVAGALTHYLCPRLIGRSPFDVVSIHTMMDDVLRPAVSNGMPFAKACVDVAIHDLAGQLSGLPIHRLLGGKERDTVPLSWAIGLGTPDEMGGWADKYRDCSCFKVKVGGDADLDILRLKAVQEATPDHPIWLDANQAYSATTVLPFLEKVRELPNIVCLEQPTPSVDWLGMAAIRSRSHLPLAIDEGCFSMFDIARFTKLDVADMVVLKVCKSGGLSTMLKSAAVAEANSLDLLGSGLTDAGIGITAAVHAFSTLNLRLPAELNGPQFLADLMVDGLEINHAVVTVPDGPGLGVKVREDDIRSCAENTVEIS